MRDDTSLVSFLLGGLTGAALATLFLPRAGAATRALRKGARERQARLSAWRSRRASDDRLPAVAPRADRVPEPGLSTTTSRYLQA
jgi:gas vesicle protein